MFGFIIAMHVLICIFLILVILIQPGKGYGLSETFGGTAQTLFGTRSATFITRATAICATIFLVTCLGISMFSSRKSRSVMERVKIETPKKEAVPVSANQVQENIPVQPAPIALPAETK
ncbi:MAG: preprotein translocase subunit SecG [Candidatus Omnitrophica bacterium]|nr:preprotein translocase subunit SecG [Candidatus Omnitrophota bacterium]